MADNQLKKYRVRTIDGYVIIDAKNIHSAISKARCEIGQLPNDINKKVCNNILLELSNIGNQINEAMKIISNNSKHLNWDDTYKATQEIASKLEENSLLYKELAGSLMKVNKQENNE